MYPDETMGEERFTALEEDDITELEVLPASGLNEQLVPRQQ